MKSTKPFNTVQVLGLLLAVLAVNARLNCKKNGKSEVICTADNKDFILQRGLVSDNNKTTKITLRNCRITKVDFEAFENDHKLEYLDLSVNKIAKIQLGVLDGNRLVTNLNLSHNLLTTFPLGLFDQKTNLEVLDLKSNKLNSLELGIFDPLEKLVHVDLSSNELVGNRIDPFIFDKSSKIKFLDFSRNNMSESPDNLLHALRELDFLNLDGCSLKVVPSFAVQPNLGTMKHLILSTNQISKIDEANTFLSLINLEILNLAENAIEQLTSDVFKPLKKLRMIVLRNNKLKTLPDSLFFNIKAIGNVDMSYNLIEYVPVNAFRGTSIKNLNLSHNRFSYLEANFCLELQNSGTNVSKFYFNDNPWQCACLNEILKEVKTYDIRYNSVKYNGGNAVCVTTNTFICKRQMADNELFIEMFDRKGKQTS